LVRAAAQGRGWARWLFAAFLAFFALGHMSAVLVRSKLPDRDDEAWVKLLTSEVLTVLYSLGAAVVGLSAGGRPRGGGRTGRKNSR
jgi:hypothetical protein